VVVVSLFAVVSLTSSAFAAKRNDDATHVQNAQTQSHKEKAKPKGWIAKILDIVADKL
jgi:hypothetical protein